MSQPDSTTASYVHRECDNEPAYVQRFTGGPSAGVRCEGCGRPTDIRYDWAQVCGRCRRPFVPSDTDPLGAAQYQDWGFCRRCVDRCHESSDFMHSCVICRGEA